MNGSAQDSDASFLRKQAWDYFSTHASQRQPARWLLSFLLCLFAFIFWKLDQRNRALIKNAERALKHFEQADQGEPLTKVFGTEETETNSRRKRLTGWRRLQVWHWTLSYSDCFNLVFAVFAALGVAGIVAEILHRIYTLQCFRALHWHM